MGENCVLLALFFLLPGCYVRVQKENKIGWLGIRGAPFTMSLARPS